MFPDKFKTIGVICWGCGTKNCEGVDPSILRKTLCDECSEDLIDTLSNSFIPLCTARHRKMWENIKDVSDE